MSSSSREAWFLTRFLIGGSPVQPGSPGNRTVRIYLGTFLIALVTLAVEIALLRLLSSISWYHLAFFAISTAMLGMTAGSVTVYLRQDLFSGTNLNMALARACVGFAFATSRNALFLPGGVAVLGGIAGLLGWSQTIPGLFQIKDVVAFYALFLVLIFRPAGLLGERLASEDRA